MGVDYIESTVCLLNRRNSESQMSFVCLFVLGNRTSVTYLSAIPFTYLFFGCAGLCCSMGFSLVAVSGTYSPVGMCGPLMVISLIVGLVAPWCVVSSWIRDQTHESCIGRWILYH